MSCGELGKGAKTEHTPEPTGWFFTDDPQVVAMPGSGYFPGPTPPNDAINLVPLYAHPDPRVAELEKQRDELLADKMRLDFLDGNMRFKMGWHVGAAPVGNLLISSVIQPSGKITSIREAINAAIDRIKGSAA